VGLPKFIGNFGLQCPRSSLPATADLLPDLVARRNMRETAAGEFFRNSILARSRPADNSYDQSVLM
jgi:hypothetical protein